MERRWVIVAFLDIYEFKSWMYRAATAPEIKEKFIQDFYRVLQCYVSKHHGSWSKYMGDGLLTAREFAPENNERRSMLKFMLELRCLFRKAKKVLRECPGGPPKLRIRIMCGYVYKIMVIDPNDPEHVRMIPEYLEYVMNTVRALLGVNPEIPCLVTDDLLKHLGKAGSIFRSRALRNSSACPSGVNKEDIKGLRILSL